MRPPEKFLAGGKIGFFFRGTDEFSQGKNDAIWSKVSLEIIFKLSILEIISKNHFKWITSFLAHFGMAGCGKVKFYVTKGNT